MQASERACATVKSNPNSQTQKWHNVFIADTLNFMFDRYNKVLVEYFVVQRQKKNYFIMGSNLFNKYNLIWCAIKKEDEERASERNSQCVYEFVRNCCYIYANEMA